MEKLYEINIRSEMKCFELEDECKELREEWKEHDVPIREIKEQSAQYGKKTKALLAQLDSIRSRNRKSKNMQTMVHETVSKLKAHTELQVGRCKQLSLAVDSSHEQLKQLEAAAMNNLAEIRDLKSKMFDWERKAASQSKRNQNSAHLESRLGRNKCDSAKMLQQSRANDANIHTNGNEFASLSRQRNQLKEKVSKAEQRRAELENAAEQSSKQIREILKIIDSLRIDCRQYGDDQQKVQKLQLEKTVLRKEIEFVTKTTRNPASKQEQTNSAKVQKKAENESEVPFAAQPVKEETSGDDDLMRNIMLINPVRRASAQLDTSGSITTNFSAYGDDGDSSQNK